MPLNPSNFCDKPHRARQDCPKECLKSQLWLKMAFGDRKKMNNPSVMALSFPCGMWDPTWPRRYLDWQDLSNNLYFLSKKLLSMGTRQGGFSRLGLAWLAVLLRWNLSPHSHSAELHRQHPLLSLPTGSSLLQPCRLQEKPWLGWGAAAALGCIYIPHCSRGANHSPDWNCRSARLSREIGRIQWHFCTEIRSEYLETDQPIVWNTAVCSNSLAFMAGVNNFLMFPYGASI